MEQIKATICSVRFPVTSVGINDRSKSRIFASAGLCKKVVVWVELEHQDCTVCLGQGWEESPCDMSHNVVCYGLWKIWMCDWMWSVWVTSHSNSTRDHAKSDFKTNKQTKTKCSIVPETWLCSCSLSTCSVLHCGRFYPAWLQLNVAYIRLCRQA